MWGNTLRVRAAHVAIVPCCADDLAARCAGTRDAGTLDAKQRAPLHVALTALHPNNTGSTRVAYQRAGCIHPSPHHQAGSTGTAGCHWAGRQQRAAPSTVPPPHLQGARKDTCMCTNACTRSQLPHSCMRMRLPWLQWTRGTGRIPPIRRPPRTTKGKSSGRTTDRVCDWPNSDLPWSLL